ncbi:MAG TPA: SDR family oxidoreductase [Candidatus Didemnitutus sp.]|nr:SDR family oxidoreductase [Candidatus Didemnitutus sp.]
MRLVITGTSSGIGRALAEQLLDAGHEVWGLARSDQSEFAAAHRGFRGARCNVADYAAVSAVAEKVAAAWPGLDGLIACAGTQGEIGRTLTANPDRWQETVHANLVGTFNTVRAFAGLLAHAPRRAKIICFSGGGATKARENFSAYGAAKTGIVRLVETIAQEERDRPLDINAVAPGPINTRMTEEVIRLGPGAVGEAEYRAAVEQKRTGGSSLAKVSGLVDWLLSPASDGISGLLLSAPWDPWSELAARRADLARSDIYRLRRIVPDDRNQKS